MTPSFDLEVGFASDVGPERQRNEDSFAIYVPYPGDDNPSDLSGLLLVADGMGGERAGDRASQLAAERVRHWLTSGEYLAWPEHQGDDGLERALRRAAREVSNEIFQLGEDDPSIRGLGSTLVLAAFAGDRVTVVNVGDSRCYRIRGETIERLSVDHSWVERQVEAGVLSRDEARHHPQRNVLTRSLGDAQPPEPDVRTEPLRPGDVFLLCSDGLTGGLGDDELLDVAHAHPSPQGLADELVRLANERDGSDNVTVLVGRVYEESDATVELASEDAVAARAVARDERRRAEGGEATTLAEAATPADGASAAVDAPTLDGSELDLADLDATDPDLGARPAKAADKAPRRGCAGLLAVGLLGLVLGGVGTFAGLRWYAAELVDRGEALLLSRHFDAARTTFDRFFALTLDGERGDRLLERLGGLEDPVYTPLTTATAAPADDAPADDVPSAAREEDETP